MNNYWNQFETRSNNDFIEGIILGLTAFAVWNTGEQTVGVTKIPLEDVIKEVKVSLNYKQQGE